MVSTPPKPATRNPNPCTGFTLVEVLVVMVLVGITLALIGLNLMPDDGRTVRNEAQRLALLLEQARDEAVAREGDQCGRQPSGR